MKTESTLERIQKIAKAEFLDNGFTGASLRAIVKKAGVTTGAFYGYYASKEALFDSLVGKQYEKIMEIFNTAQDSFLDNPEDMKPNEMCKYSRPAINEMVDYIYQNFDSFRLLLCSSSGTKYENMLDKMVEKETYSTNVYIKQLRKWGYEVPDIDPMVMHMIINGLFSGMFEVVVHQMSYAKAKKYIKQIRDFNEAGWARLFGIQDIVFKEY